MAHQPGPPGAVEDDDVDVLLADALAAPLSGWDFSWAAGRVHTAPLSWSYEDLAVARLTTAGRVLDVDTGGGELLSSLLCRAVLPAADGRRVTATEGWPPNIPVAVSRLGPLGVVVVEAPADHLPLADASVDLVLDRHGRLVAGEVARVLAPGGSLITQQVGSEDCTDLNEALGAAAPRAPGSWTARVAADSLTRAGLVVEDVREERPAMVFDDVGAVVLHLRSVPWQLPGTSVTDHLDTLRRLGARGPLEVRTHRFLVTARRPATP
ncbi:class I SAM-dependent methyltransferase [Quadrisphaera oryzae]|uniref:class I SAM-dependent methyltransferase n=1 Tax=Quadrisphaera TaxID=317661 RepID=UPI001644FA68|nr:class I SAM-dependent methyltransferase [Quadrisphaera sp. RL12-1S]MBC3762012.1 class I SAM-dependent methyltransferase [Quadrisphaera sp. RL12-1S]